jgi:hypothetical protein
LTLENHIGHVSTHEAVHGTDRASTIALSPNASKEEIEKKPVAAQSEYIKQINKVRNPEKKN